MSRRAPRHTPDVLLRPRPASGVQRIAAVADVALEPIALQPMVGPRPSSSRPLVLVVDDQPDLRDLIAEVLRMQRARVVTTSSVAGALMVLRSIHVDAVVTDYAMPEADGLVLLRALRAEERWAHVRAFMVSAHFDHDGLASDARTLGAAFFRKPLDVEALASIVLERP